MIILKNNFTIDNINDTIEALEQVIQNNSGSMSPKKLVSKAKSIKRLVQKKNSINSQLLKPLETPKYKNKYIKHTVDDKMNYKYVIK